ncbi:MAG: hypothetical protein HOW73_10475 [Polyangiaceae bacterium]|nr:hypothetical protein [Polyangiaceae bacterium]
MATLVDIRPAERIATLTAMGALLASTAGHMMLETARDALFLAKLPATTLPWMYLAIAALGLAITRLTPARKQSRTASLAMLLAAGVSIAFYAALRDPGPIGLYALFVWTGTFGAVVNVELWLLLGAAFDVGQAKRLFGLIGAGAVLGATLGALVARVVASTFGARELLVFAAAFFASAWLPARLLERRVAKIAAAFEEVRAEAAQRTSLYADLKNTARDPYLLDMGVFLVLGTVTLAFGDYIFKASMAAAFSGERLATAFATAYLAFNALSLVVQVALTGAALRWLGVKRALFVLPLLMIGEAAGVVVLPTLGAAIAMRATDGALRHSLHKTTSELLFLPLADADRRRAKPVLDLVTQRGGQALSAIAILILVELGATSRLLAAMAMLTGVGWVVAAARVGAPYVDAFRKRLRLGAIEIDERIPELDLGALEVIFAALNSSKDAEVMGALDLLSAQGRVRLIPALILYHPSKDVVLRALSLFVHAGRDDFLPITKRLLDSDDPEVRAAALRARSEVARDRRELEGWLGDSRPEIRATALVALASAHAIDDETARAQLRTMIRHEDAGVALAVIRAMGASPSPLFVDDLLAVAEGPFHGTVRAEAAIALGEIGATYPDESHRALPALLELLPLRHEGPGARAAIDRIGEPALVFLDRYLATTEARGPVAWAAVRALSDFDPSRVVPLMMRHLRSSPDGVVRYRCLKHLKRMLIEEPSLRIDKALLTEVARSTLRDALDLVELRVLVEKAQRERPTTAAAQLLLTLLGDKRSHAMGRVFILLSLLHPKEDFDRVARSLASKDARIRASSRELCHNVVSTELRDLLAVLIDDIGDDAKIERALGAERRRFATYEDLMHDLVRRSGELGAIARYHAKEIGMAVAEAPAPLGAQDSPFTHKVSGGTWSYTSEAHVAAP